MSEVIVTLVRGKDSSHMDIENAKDDHIGKIIEGFFAVSGAPAPVFSEPSNKPVIKTDIRSEAKRTQTPKKFYPEPNYSTNNPEAVAKLVPESVDKHVHNNIVVSGEPTTMEEVYPIAVKPSYPDNAPEHVKTGIKRGEDSKPNRYKCRYRCTKCDHQGNHYIPEGVETVDCYECQTALHVKKATPGTQGIQADRFNNWFVAGNQKPVERVVYSNSHKLK